ncbi:hypothetical protein BX600DRAFT_56401 [Xylariales sp. PMI_506]|nr:hypothetical protein BX600DRAFT_56401 [Xylariales sp. PMI_506]
MAQAAEKPLLSDYEVLNDEKKDVPEQNDSACQHCVSRGAALDRNPKFQKFSNIMMKIANPISRKSAGFGCEPFVPLPVDQECQKAARIIKSFSYRTPDQSAAETAHQLDANPNTAEAPHIVTIPPSVLASAAGLIIFTTGRLGFGNMSGSTGSGLLLARQDPEDDGGSSGGDSGSKVTAAVGQWGSPVPIQAYSLGAGPLAFGAEVSDRVYVLNSRSALDMFRSARFEIGPEVVLAAGPYGGGGGVTFSGMVPARESPQQQQQQKSQQQQQSQQQPQRQHQHQHQHQQGQAGAFQGLRDSLGQPVYCYMRSRGLYAGLQAEGTVFVQHPDRHVPDKDAAVLIDALKEAEGLSY